MCFTNCCDVERNENLHTFLLYYITPWNFLASYYPARGLFSNINGLFRVGHKLLDTRRRCIYDKKKIQVLVKECYEPVNLFLLKEAK